jgi:hypothetical protein
MSLRFRVLILGGIALTLGVFSLWKIFEFDLFWQIRYGTEILSGHTIQTMESWSHTALGFTFINHEWLSTVIFAWISNFGKNIERLVGLRGALVAIWSFLALWQIQKLLSKKTWLFIIQASSLASWIYVICSFRFQMRPDLFAAVHFALLLCLWKSKVTPLKKNILGILLVWSWSNFHIGTAPIGVFFLMSAFIWNTTNISLKVRLFWASVTAAAWFATPLGWQALKALWINLGLYDEALIGNPDFQPFTLKLLSFYEAGWCMLLWACYTLIAGWEIFKDVKSKTFYWKFNVLIFGTLTILTLFKIRAVHYQVLFALPWVALFVERAGKNFIPGYLFLTLWALPDQINYIAKPLGFSIHEQSLPVETTRLLKEIKPQANLLNDYAHGGYLDLYLAELPISIDGRGAPFLDYMREQKAALASPQEYADFLTRHQINVVLEKVPQLVRNEIGELTDSHATLYPQNKWALIGFDDSSSLYLRRIKEHETIIQKYEFYFLRRGLPPTYGSNFEGLSESIRSGFESEINRCLDRSSKIIYCLIGKAAFLKRNGQSLEALSILAMTEKLAPNEPVLLVEYAQQAEAAGKVILAKRLRDRFNKLTNSID